MPAQAQIGECRIVPIQNVNTRRGMPNAFNQCLDNEAELWEWIMQSGGLTTVCCKENYPGVKYERAPWIVIPKQGEKFTPISNIVLPGIVSQGINQQVLQFRVPLGYDGVIKGVVCQFGGTGFIEGSGDLTWRLQVNRRWVKDYSNITTSLGNLRGNIQNYGDAIRLFSNELVTFYVNVAAGADARLSPTGLIICCLQGWHYPIR